MRSRLTDSIIRDLKCLADPARAEHAAPYLKTGVGSYGEGDLFFGIPVPLQRTIVASHARRADIRDVEILLSSEYHECRLCGLIPLVHLFEKADERTRETYALWYVDRLDRVNNWDLIDCSAHKIPGIFLEDKPRDLLYVLAHTRDLWGQRVSVIAPLHFIRNEDVHTTPEIADILLNHDHDLIHKAVGWMLREVGKREMGVLETYLKPRYAAMPRTMLGYAVEKFEPELRRAYINGTA